MATSITAFVGRAARGPTDRAVVVNSFGDFESMFGGLWLDNALGFSVRDFFLNGGSTAVIVRLYNADPAAGVLALAPLDVGALKFIAWTPGKWGVELRVTVDQTNTSDTVAKMLGVPGKADLFNVTVTDTATARSERFLNLTVKNSARRVDLVLAAESALLRYSGAVDPNTAIAAGKDVLGTAEDKLAAAKAALADKQNKTPGADTSAEKAAVDAATAELNTALDKARNAVSDGLWLTVPNFLPANGEADKKGLFALEQVDLFNLLCIPPYHAPIDAIDVDPNLIATAAAYCERRRAMLLVDSPKNWTKVATATQEFTDPNNDTIGTRSANSALFFPRLKYPNPLRNNQLEVYSAIGAVAGIFARTDGARGVWKAPAGLEATLNGVPQLSVSLTDPENGQLNPLGINCLRAFSVGGRVVWGARTLRGADQLADDYKYIPVRRTALFIEESVFRGLKFAVFEPNDEPLWAQIRLNVGAFMHDLFRQGAFQGSSPRDAYFVKCDKETTTQTDINLGIVNVVVGFAPLKPAEFVIISLQQIAGQVEV
ncbi:MAG TPA: phage tail sheath subtilisin-like domain-containing protein [Kofleriaceae bacterium]|nr:phage tail sheath subtilisin-like domain-containing protein [Kofleriaceae bacterium]